MPDTPTIIPTIGRIVRYRHVDGHTYPAIILEVAPDPEAPGGWFDQLDHHDAQVAWYEEEREAGRDPDMPPVLEPAPMFVAHIEVLRPRGHEWKRCTEGDSEGQYHWPTIR